ncbi:hypothetical protein BC834DRAFT_865819 [Gloeopeniophorella convolvens]|nr:hypothetical protein BC834DRAFT_865819 [Gloeopeniophorella convolvens]
MSTAPRLPTVRLPSAIPNAGTRTEPSRQDSVLLELPSSSKFGFAWPADAVPAPPLPSLADRHTSLSSSNADSAPSEHEAEPRINAGADRSTNRRRGSGAGRKGHGEESDSSDFTPTNRPSLDQSSLDQSSPSLPRLSRAFSAPLPSQIGYLKNPKRMPSNSPPHGDPVTPGILPGPNLTHLHELSLELADSVQMVIQTLLQISPPQVFDPAKEQFSACALPVPTPSVSALFTAMKSLNYMSANMAAFSTPLRSSSPDPSPQTRNGDTGCATISDTSLQAPQGPVQDYDIGETLQSVGDALSGMAADAAVDLVLFHGDVGMKHIAVKGDEIGISYTLSHIVRQILATAHRGDCVEVGLYLVAPVEVSPDDAGEPSVLEIPLDATEPADATSTPDPNMPLRCTFQITHVFANQSAETPKPQAGTPPVRVEPIVDSHILRRLIHHIGASFTHERTDTTLTCKLSMTLERGSPAVVNPSIVLTDDDPILQAFPDFKLSGEPTLEDLAQFVDTLKGKKASLYANATGIFAQHLTSYLTAWGLDVSHASSDSDAEASPIRETTILPSVEYPPIVNEAIGGGFVLQTLPEQDSPPTAPPTAKPLYQSPSFILIDDDVSVLRERLRKLRAELPYPFQLARKRPNLAANHRPRSSPQVTRAMGIPSAASPRSPAVIIHFTSLANFKLVKGILQSVLGPSGGTASRMPEVIVIPKPAGPRRVLTALHTAATKPIVDPFFSPIATSPISPGLYPAASYFHQTFSPRSPMGRLAVSSRSNSQQLVRSPKGTEPFLDNAGMPPSPLGLSEGINYFSEAAEKLGSSPSSGLVIQSPDGQPAGIFFHPPRARSSRPTSHSVSVDHGPMSSRGSRRHSDYAERVRSAGGVTFLNLPTPTQQRRSSPMPQVAVGADVVIPITSLGAGPIGESSAPPSLSQVAASVAARPVVKRVSTIEALRKVASPPSSPRVSPTSAKMLPPRRSSGPRRSQMEAPSSTSSSIKKGNSSEPSIVPPISVLIVEDNPIEQTLLSTFMRKKKIKYDVANNGEEAVDKWKSGRFHLILMDIQMPVMDGISATKEIRRLEKMNAPPGFPGTPQTEGQRTPSDVASNDSRVSSSPFRSSVIIVALTASSLQSDRVAALAAGCNDFLTKPVSREWLNSKIIEWGSIKALQMFADNRPDLVKTISTDQTAQAQNIARLLHMPEGRASPSPSRPASQPIAPGAVIVPGSSTSGSTERTPVNAPFLVEKLSVAGHGSSDGKTPESILTPQDGNTRDSVSSGETAHPMNATEAPPQSAEQPPAEGAAQPTDVSAGRVGEQRAEQ